MSLPARPAPPFDDWPPPVRDEAGAYFLWVAAPDVVVTQAFWREMSEAQAERTCLGLEAARLEVLEGRPALIVNDWRQTQNISARGQRRMGEIMRGVLKPGDLRGILTALPEHPSIGASLTLSVARLVARATSGVDIQRVHDLDVTLRDEGVSPLDADLGPVRAALA